MARVKFGAMMVDARGKLGGHVFTKARSGATIRTKVTPVNGQTVAQGIVRNNLSTISQKWRTLSEEQRIAWNNLAASTGRTNVFGDTYYPSGKNLFTSVNINILNSGNDIIENAPGKVGLPLFTMAQPTVSVADGITLDLAYSGNPQACYVLVSASRPSSSGVFNFSGKHFQISVFPLIGTISPQQLYGEYVAKFGAPAVGQKISFTCRIVNSVTGQVSALQTQQTIVVE